MHVLATAGHVDHGKSTLVRALTGIEPDRWEEERRRGLTIDLGYAWTTLPDGQEVAFVDVPGHERFITNMLAGVGPVPAVMFVVAADEGWRQQSQEHLDAVAALGIEHGLLVITRSDLADPAPALAEARARLAVTSLAGAEAVTLSARTGDGFDDLRAALGRLVAGLPFADPTTRARLWIDRVFTITGVGTVATGTLQQGTLHVGERVDLGGRTATVRGMEMLERPADHAAAVARVAVNLRGVDVRRLARGHAVTSGTWPLTRSVDVRLEPVAAETRPQPSERMMAHVGTAAHEVRLRPLDDSAVRLTWPVGLPLQVGDRIILRDPGQQRVLGGAVVLDTDPPPLMRRGAARRRAKELADSPIRLDPACEVARRGAMRADQLSALGGDPSQAAGAQRHGSWLVSDAQWRAWVSALTRIVTTYAAEHPRQARMPMSAASHAVGLPDSALLADLAEQANLDLTGGFVAPSGVTASLGDQETAVAAVEERLASRPFSPPDRDELAAAGLTAADLAIAVRLGRLLDLGDLVVVLPSGPALAMRTLADLPQPFTTSEARQALQTSRRVVIPLLEHLDHRGWTRRLDAGHRVVVGYE